jgi:hypothetical protein
LNILIAPPTEPFIFPTQPNEDVHEEEENVTPFGPDMDLNYIVNLDEEGVTPTTFSSQRGMDRLMNKGDLGRIKINLSS